MVECDVHQVHPNLCHFGELPEGYKIVEEILQIVFFWTKTYHQVEVKEIFSKNK